MRKYLGLIILLLCLTPAAAYADDINYNQSFLQVAVQQGEVAPYQSTKVIFGLRNASFTNLVDVPAGTKIYYWAERDGVYAPSMRLDESLVPEGIYTHETQYPGVYVMDGAALNKDISLSLFFTEGGDYTLRCAALPSSAFNIYNAYSYQTYQLKGSLADFSHIRVFPSPGESVSYMILSSQINGVTTASQVVYGNSELLYEKISVPAVSGDETRLTATLTRSDGNPVGAGVKVQATMQSGQVALKQSEGYTNSSGQVTFAFQGNPAPGDSIHIGVVGGLQASLPLYTYDYTPQKVRLDIGSKEMLVDGKRTPMDTAAVVVAGRTYLPYRSIGEVLGAKIDYNHTIRTITTYYQNKVITMTIGFNQYAINGHINHMDAVPYINSDGRTMVPIRFIAEATGYRVDAVAAANGTTLGVELTKVV